MWFTEMLSAIGRIKLQPQLYIYPWIPGGWSFMPILITQRKKEIKPMELGLNVLNKIWLYVWHDFSSSLHCGPLKQLNNFDVNAWKMIRFALPINNGQRTYSHSSFSLFLNFYLLSFENWNTHLSFNFYYLYMASDGDRQPKEKKD